MQSLSVPHPTAVAEPARRRRTRLVALLRGPIMATVLGLLLVAGGGVPAQATTIDDFVLSAYTVVPQTTITATATFTATEVGALEVDVTMPPELVGVATWKSASLSATNPLQTCVVDNPPSTAACRWNPQQLGQTTTLTAVLDLPSTTPGGSYKLTASGWGTATLEQQFTVVTEATPSVSVSPGAATAGSTAVATGTFVARNSGDIKVGMYLEGTGGKGTFGTPVSVGGLSNCTLETSKRVYTCTWQGATAGDTRSIVIPVVVASSARLGSTFSVRSCVNTNYPSFDRCAATDLAIVASPVLGYPDGAGNVGVAFGPLLPQTSGLTAPIRYAVTKSTLPVGLSLNAATGAISGTPTAAGAAVVQITATGASGKSASTKVSIIVSGQAPAPHLAYPAGAGQVGVAISPLAPQSSGLTAPVTYAVTAGSLPAGLVLDAATGTISGTPTAAGSSTATVTATASSGTTATAQVTVTVTATPGTPSLAYPAGEGHVGLSIHPLTPQVAGLTGTLSYAVVSGALPKGVLLSATSGVISGIPLQVGTFTATVQVTGTEGTATTPVSITVHDRMVQRPARPSYAPPQSLTVPGTTVVTPALAITNAGQTIRTRVTCIPTRTRSTAVVAPTGDTRAACRIVRGPGTRVAVTVTRADVRVLVVQTAPGSLAYERYVARASYVGGHRT